MPESTRPARVPVEERLFSLVLALLATDSGLTKHEILSTVHGYSQRAAAGDTTSLERQFERDKDDIRELGVPLETVEDASEPGSNQNVRYRIRRGDYELPTDVVFSADETALLGLAALVWREGSLSGESRRALLKLRGMDAAESTPVLGYEPRIRLRDPAFEPLTAALEKGQIVRFEYLKPGDVEATVREVIPLALVQYEGRWHLSSQDVASGEHKMFLLRRIVGPIATGRIAPDRPGDHAAAALADLERVAAAHVAELRVAPDSDAARRLARRSGAEAIGEDRIRLRYVDTAILADDLTAFGPEVVVESPPDLRSAVRDRLARIAADHG